MDKERNNKMDRNFLQNFEHVRFLHQSHLLWHCYCSLHHNIFNNMGLNQCFFLCFGNYNTDDYIESLFIILTSTLNLFLCVLIGRCQVAVGQLLDSCQVAVSQLLVSCQQAVSKQLASSQQAASEHLKAVSKQLKSNQQAVGTCPGHRALTRTVEQQLASSQ